MSSELNFGTKIIIVGILLLIIAAVIKVTESRPFAEKKSESMQSIFDNCELGSEVTITESTSQGTQVSCTFIKDKNSQIKFRPRTEDE